MDRDLNLDKSNIDHVALDVETTSLRTDCCILSIAVVPVIDERESVIQANSYYEIIELQSCLDEDMIISADTFYWWLNQSEEARQEIDSDIKRAIDQALVSLAAYIKQFYDCYIWSHKDIDAAVARTAYRKLGMTEPFDKKQMMDIRTLRLLSEDVTVDWDRIEHNAFEDAWYEAVLVRKYLKQHNI